MTTFFHAYFDPNNSRENHQQIATVTACIFTGFAVAFFINDCPYAGLATLAIDVALTGFKRVQMGLTPAKKDESMNYSASPV